MDAMRTYSAALLKTVLAETVPLYGRMIHHGDLTEEEQLYDTSGRHNNAVDRGNLNKILLDALPSHVKIFFRHKLTGADLVKRKARFAQIGAEEGKEVEVSFDLMLGCDGAHSNVRNHLMKVLRMDYEQRFIDAIWCEFTIPPADAASQDKITSTAKDGFRMSPDHLHIWPGAKDMFIAIPSIDQSFTCTLFAPSATFKALEGRESTLESFFDEHFPGAAELVGRKELHSQFQQNPHLPLISIKCQPHHYGSSVVILGDAAHAMVPFYGQGMNAGLEDVKVLFQHLDRHPATEAGRSAALEAYGKERVADAHTINDFALANYWEMRAGVTSTTRLLRKKVEEFLSDKVPWSGFKTQYSRVSFSTQRYSEVKQDVARQGHILLRGLIGTLAVPVLGAVAWYFHHTRTTPSHPVWQGLSLASIGARFDRIFRR